MTPAGKQVRTGSVFLTLLTLAFFLQSGAVSSPYPGKKSASTQTIVGYETEYEEQSDLAEGSELTELVYGNCASSKIEKPGLSQINPSRQDRFQFQYSRLLSQHLLNIPPPALS